MNDTKDELRDFNEPENLDLRLIQTVFYETIATGQTCAWVGRNKQPCGTAARYHVWLEAAWPMAVTVPHYCCVYHFHFLRHRKDLRFKKLKAANNGNRVFDVEIKLRVTAPDREMAKVNTACYILTGHRRGGVNGTVSFRTTEKTAETKSGKGVLK